MSKSGNCREARTRMRERDLLSLHTHRLMTGALGFGVWGLGFRCARTALTADASPHDRSTGWFS